ncbi:hypothetical protein [Ohessyouella blattaphilus]|uniref:Flavodoxin-like domain-containing protein n=1 Tax=Ohessyouella blattaphilus TaxID=2949333 RepID=A0ABT1EKY5_9FIRM|nr:hypothetical protein [Ohessyouella blattaphilus]MCP1111368.1 hypothetical protein [Ohessyouella blattaphilus]MCR8564762.1 hypothetical protein [Ohessyouella blattaphilus]
MKVTQIYFSPSGSTKKISQYLATGLSDEVASKQDVAGVCIVVIFVESFVH